MASAWAQCRICGHRETEYGGADVRVDLTAHVMTAHPETVPAWIPDLRLSPLWGEQNRLARTLPWMVDPWEFRPIFEQAELDSLRAYRAWNRCSACTLEAPCQKHQKLARKEPGIFTVILFDERSWYRDTIAEHGADRMPAHRLAA